MNGNTNIANKRMPKKNKIKPIVVAAVILGLVSAGIGGLLWHNHQKNVVKTTPSGVRLAPPTKQEKEQANQNKAAIVQQQEDAQKHAGSTPAGSKKQVSVVITNASTSSVTGYVSGVIEDGGTCTATFTQGSTVVTATSSAISNVSNTQCPPITPNLPNSNTWSVVLSYNSTTAAGSSAAQTF